MDDLETEAAAATEEKPIADETEDLVEGDEATAEGAEPEAEDKKTRSQERREQRKAEQERLRASEAAANAKLQEKESQLDRLRAAAKSLPEPKESDFEGKYEEYLDARTAYVSIKALEGRAEADIQAEIEQRRQDVEAVKQRQREEAAQNWGQAVQEAQTRYSDFEAVVFDKSVPISERMASAIMSTDSPADIAYRIASDRALARDISVMSDLEMGRAIGRIEASLALPKPKLETQAPQPIAPVRPGGTAAKDPAKMSASEWRAWREAGGRL